MTDRLRNDAAAHGASPIRFDASALKASLSKHEALLRSHGNLESVESNLTKLEQGFSRNSQAFIQLAKNTDQGEPAKQIETLAHKMLDRGHQIINRAIQTCQERKAFESAFEASVAKHGELRTTEEVAQVLHVSPPHVDAIMGRAGAKKIHVAGRGKSLTKAFWRLEDCLRTQSQRRVS